MDSNIENDIRHYQELVASNPAFQAFQMSTIVSIEATLNDSLRIPEDCQGWVARKCMDWVLQAFKRDGLPEIVANFHLCNLLVAFPIVFGSGGWARNYFYADESTRRVMDEHMEAVCYEFIKCYFEQVESEELKQINQMERSFNCEK